MWSVGWLYCSVESGSMTCLVFTPAMLMSRHQHAGIIVLCLTPPHIHTHTHTPHIQEEEDAPAASAYSRWALEERSEGARALLPVKACRDAERALESPDSGVYYTPFEDTPVTLSRLTWVCACLCTTHTL